jgi:hypothetical protein
MLLLIGTTNIVSYFIEDVVIPGAQDASLSAIDAHKNCGLRISAKNTKREQGRINPY